MTLNEMLTLHEGRRKMLYKCSAGKLTIGIGRNIEDRGLSEDEIDYLFANDVRTASDELERAFPWSKDLDPVRKAVLIDMSFNMGIDRLSKFKNTLAMIAAGEYDKAAEAMLQSLWASQVGNRSRRLSSMMKTGEWPSK